MPTLHNIDHDKFISFYNRGLTDPGIGIELGVPTRKVNYYRNKLNLLSNAPRFKIEKIGDDFAKCSHCDGIKPIGQFSWYVYGNRKPFQLSFCNNCRSKTYYESLELNIDKFLKDKFARTKARSIRNNRLFNISFDSFRNQYHVQKGLCFYTDVEMSHTVLKGLNRNNLSIDKIIPENGYSEGNVVFCTHKVNTIKSDITLDEMKEWMPGWYDKVQKFLIKESFNE